MDDVEADVAGPRDPHHRVQVRAVVVQRRADVVDDRGDLLDATVPQPERVRVGEHQARDLVVGLGPQVLDVDAAVVGGGDLDHLVAGHGHRRGVRAVRGVGREHLRAHVAAVLVVGAREQDAGQLAVRARAGLQRDVRQPGDLAQRALQPPHQLERALRLARVLQRMQAGKAVQRRHAFVQLGVVLHRARSERVEALVEVEVPGRQAHVVAHDLRLGDLGQLRALAAAQTRGNELVQGLLGHVERGRHKRAAALDRALVDRRGRVALLRGLDRGVAPGDGAEALDLGVGVQAVVRQRLVHGAPPARPRRAPRPAGRCPPASAAR